MASRRNRTGDKVEGARASGAGDSVSGSGKSRVMKAALNILASRSCSEGQLRDRLSAKGWAEAGLVEDCIKKLKELGYVNDDLFADGYASYRVKSRPIGRARLARELVFKKVSKKAIDGALDRVFGEVGEETLIDRAIARRLRTHGRPADRAAAKRMFDHLTRLGFEYDLILKKLSGLKGKTTNDE